MSNLFVFLDNFNWGKFTNLYIRLSTTVRFIAVASKLYLFIVYVFSYKKITMNIGSPQALIQLMQNDNITSIDKLKECLHSLGRICSCQKQRKNQKHEECNTMYINFVSSNVSNLADYFKTKTTDNEITFSYGSNHILKTIKLR